jgi:hypothetical protein
MAEDRDQWRAFVKTVMNITFLNKDTRWENLDQLSDY